MFWEFYLIVNIKMMRVKRFFLTHDFFADMKPDAIGHKTTLVSGTAHFGCCAIYACNINYYFRNLFNLYCPCIEPSVISQTLIS